MTSILVCANLALLDCMVPVLVSQIHSVLAGVLLGIVEILEKHHRLAPDYVLLGHTLVVASHVHASDVLQDHIVKRKDPNFLLNVLAGDMD